MRGCKSWPEIVIDMLRLRRLCEDAGMFLTDHSMEIHSRDKAAIIQMTIVIPPEALPDMPIRMKVDEKV